MTRINIDLPDDLHKNAKLQALKHDQTLKQYVIRALKERVHDKD